MTEREASLGGSSCGKVHHPRCDVASSQTAGGNEGDGDEGGVGINARTN